MSGYAWAALGMLAAGTAIYTADKYLGNRIRAAIAVRRFRRDIEWHEQHEHREALIARLQDEIAETERRLREHYGDGGDT